MKQPLWEMSNRLGSSEDFEGREMWSKPHVGLNFLHAHARPRLVRVLRRVKLHEIQKRSSKPYTVLGAVLSLKLNVCLSLIIGYIEALNPVWQNLEMGPRRKLVK